MAGTREGRKLVAILAADMAGFSRLMHLDEEGTLAKLKGHLHEVFEPAVALHHGRIVKTTGDGVLIEFPSPVEAMRCAMEVQGEVSRRNAGLPGDRQQIFRIGLHLGDVIEDGGDIFGDAVNIAARLQNMCESGGICLSASLFDQVRDRVHFPYVDLGEQNLKNIARTVRVYAVKLGSIAASVDEGAPRAVTPLAVASGAAAVMAATAALWWFLSQPAPPPVATATVGSAIEAFGRPMVAVIPFVNQSDDPGQEYFSDGVTEDIIDKLGRFPTLAVLARSAVLPYKNKALKPAAIGAELGARYLVEGSVRKSSDRIRVTARLTDASQGRLLWSQQFDEELKDIFLLQDSIAHRIAGSLVPQLTRIESQRALAKPTANLDAYDLMLRGRELMAKATRAANREARQLFERAAQLDPDYAAAHAALGTAIFDMTVFGWTEFAGQMREQAEALAQRAIALDDANADGHRLLAKIYLTEPRYDRALAEAERAIALNASDAESHGVRGAVLILVGRNDEAIQSLETEFRFDPTPKSASSFYLGLAYYFGHRHEAAVRLLEQAMIRYPEHPFTPAVLAAAYGQLGREVEAARIAAVLKRVNPFFDPESFGSSLQSSDSRAYLRDGLKKAGID